MFAAGQRQWPCVHSRQRPRDLSPPRPAADWAPPPASRDGRCGGRPRALQCSSPCLQLRRQRWRHLQPPLQPRLQWQPGRRVRPWMPAPPSSPQPARPSLHVHHHCLRRRPLPTVRFAAVTANVSVLYAGFAQFTRRQAMMK